jgi:N-acetylneuraminate synthase
MNTILVADCGINHNGDLEIAKKLIDIAKDGGCQYVKFQKRTIDEVYTKEELDAPRESPWGKTFRAQKEGLEFSKEAYIEIDRYCKEKGIGWFASPWDEKSVDFLMEFDVPFIKVAAACVTHIALLKKIRATGKPVILSVGMCSFDELHAALDILGDNCEYLLSCTSTYPTKVEDMNMNKIVALKNMYEDQYRIGFSNHSAGILFITMAGVMGAEMIEYHITLDRSMYGSDQAASIESPGVMKIKDYIQDIERSRGDGLIKCLDAELPIRKKLTKKWASQ